MNIDQRLIGMKATADGNYTCTTKQETIKQVEEIIKFPLEIKLEHEAITWKDLYEPDRNVKKFGYSLFCVIIIDRESRIDNHIFMADRPPFVVCTIHDDIVVRVEYYSGHDCLSCEFDLKNSSIKFSDYNEWAD